MDELAGMLREAGFADVSIEPKEDSREFIRNLAARNEARGLRRLGQHPRDQGLRFAPC